MRILLRLLSPLLGVAVAIIGVLLVVETGWVLVRPRSAPLLVPWTVWRDRLADYAWSDTTVLVTGGALALLGLLLLLLTAGARRHDVRLSDPAEDVMVVTSPRSLARVVGHRVRAEDGVRSAAVTASARRIRVRATSSMNTETQLRPTLTARVDELVGDLPLARKPRVQVVVDSPKDRR